MRVVINRIFLLMKARWSGCALGRSGCEAMVMMDSQISCIAKAPNIFFKRWLNKLYIYSEITRFNLGPCQYNDKYTPPHPVSLITHEWSRKWTSSECSQWNWQLKLEGKLPNDPQYWCDRWDSLEITQSGQSHTSDNMKIKFKSQMGSLKLTKCQNLRENFQMTHLMW